MQVLPAALTLSQVASSSSHVFGGSVTPASASTFLLYIAPIGVTPEEYM